MLRGYEVLNRGDLDDAVRGLAPDCDLSLPPMMAAVCGTGKDSGAEVRTPTFPIIWTIEGDQVVRMEARPTRAEAFEAVGLNSEP